jgi:hypothetical protein
MNIPGFTAEGSFYHNERYRLLGILDVGNLTQAVIPQQTIRADTEELGATAVRHCITRCLPFSFCETECHTLYW